MICKFKRWSICAIIAKQCLKMNWNLFKMKTFLVKKKKPVVKLVLLLLSVSVIFLNSSFHANSNNEKQLKK